MFNLSKKLMGLGLAVYLAFSPAQINAQNKDKIIVDYHKSRYLSMNYEGLRIHTFLANVNKYKIKIASSVCPSLDNFTSVQNKQKTFEPKGETLENIVLRYESESGENVLAAINGSYFDPPTFHIIGREKINGYHIKRKSVEKKKKRVVKNVKPPKFNDYDFKFRASLLIDREGLLHIGYFDNISDADYFLTAGPMLVFNNQNVWEPAYENEKFDPLYLRPYRRSVVAITSRGNLMFVASEEITLDKLTEFLMRIKVKDAMCLDSGSSVQMILDKVYDPLDKFKKENYLIYGTQRKIVNGILVIE